MPDRAGRPALYRLCDSGNGTNWRPTRFEDELTLTRYACCVCHVVPSTTVVLPCSHALCEQCLAGCVVQDGGSVCPLDAEPFCEDECQRWQLPARKKQNLKAHCWNEADGCQFVGTVEDVLLHFERECAFHALQCPRCERRILRADIAAHYVAECSQSASCASGSQPNSQDGSSTSCYDSAILERLSTLQTQMEKLSRASRSALLRDISRAVGGLEDSSLRGMKDVEANICAMVTRQLNAGLEELKTFIREAASGHLSSVQSQMNELVEGSRQHDSSQLQEIVRMLRDSESKQKENVKTQMREIVHALRDSESELKEHVNSVEANLSSKLTHQRQSLQRGLDSLQQIAQSTDTEGYLAAGASGNEGDIPWRMEKRLILRKLEICATESLNTLESLSQHICRKNDTPWVPGIAELLTRPCVILRNDSKPLRFNVTLEKADKIFLLQDGRVTLSNQWYYRDMHIKISFSVLRDKVPTLFCVRVQCINALESSGFPFTKLDVTAASSSDRGFLPFDVSSQGKCKVCSRKNISHFMAVFVVELEMLSEDGIVNDRMLTLTFDFQK